MTAVRLEKKLCEEYESRLKTTGAEKLYRHVVGQGILNKTVCDHPELICLDYADAFFSMFRQTENKLHFELGIILRKAAHRLYRQNLRTSAEPARNARFLNIIK